MVLPPWLRKAKSRISRSRVLRSRFLLSEQELRLEAARERVRADRSGLPLSILVIELPPDRASSRDFAFLSRLLHRRLRITDMAGYLSDGRVAVLLPDTPKAGAWKVASDICDFYPVGHERPNCEVFVYPEEGAPSRSDPQHRTLPPIEGRGISLEALFAHPTPMLKRAVDVLGACVGLVVSAPLIAVLAALIKATSPGPIFYSQLREGHGGRRFRIYKLRSMRVGADLQLAALREQSEQDGPAFKMRHDPRTTWIGRLIRKTSLDELPQFWNVLLGNMSLVGPRPLDVAESLQCASWQRRRLDVMPGLTCIWQVRGRSTVSFESWMRMDLEYLRRRSFAYDVRLLLFTVPSLLIQRGPR
jgi:lipopolysaccharide/colanic/teichoic acid biosynthesis glycosyltransferase